ncbi:MAG: hypothetical protein NT118_09510, partial [Lentisphaerae bacterium]|nr:hypothetical protein [Lentisphaerota bacterium]
MTACFLSCSAMSQEKITVYRDGKTLLVQSAFTETNDLVLIYSRIANEEAYIVPKQSAIQDYAKGTMIHNGNDDYPSSGIDGYGYLGGNHGSSFARKLE